MQLSNTEKAIHNYLLSLYAKHQPEQLMGYLAQQGDVSMRNYMLAGCVLVKGGGSSVLKQLSNTEKAIHNYLLSLYAKHQPEQLMGYLAQQGDVSMNNYILYWQGCALVKGGGPLY